MQIQAILDFWFSPPMSEHWFNSTAEIDAEIRDKYQATWQKAVAGELDAWRESAEGCLALCIVLDQFPLNMFRGEAKSFSSEQKAVEVCKAAVNNQLDMQLPAERRLFLYMPLMHSENMIDQNQSVQLFDDAGLVDAAKFARHHRDIVQRFGRFPHRNKALGRASSKAEIDYLNSAEAFTG